MVQAGADSDKLFLVMRAYKNKCVCGVLAPWAHEPCTLSIAQGMGPTASKLERLKAKTSQ